MAHVRTVRTASGARAVQVVWSNRAGKREIEHIGSAHTDAEVEILRAAGRAVILAGQGELDLGLERPAKDDGVLEVTCSRMGHLLDSIYTAYRAIGLDKAAGGDDVFRKLVAARIIEPTSKFDSLRVLEEAGEHPPSYATVKRYLPVYSTDTWRERISAACASFANLGPDAIALYDVSTLYYEIHEGDGFREPGFSKERRIEPQITIGLLTDANGFPLLVNAFEGNKAETTTMLPVIKDFLRGHRLRNLIVVADAGMVSDANKKALEAEGLQFIIGTKIPELPYVISSWRAEHPGEDIPNGNIFTARWPVPPSRNRLEWTTFYQYSASRARKTLHGIDEQIRKAEDAVAGRKPVKRNRFVKLTNADKEVNRELEAKARSLAGIKGYVTNIPNPNPEFVIGAYKRLYRVEDTFRMAKSDLAARPIYHRKRDSIEAHLNIVFAAIAVGRWIETATGWTIKKFVKTARRYRTYTINANGHDIPGADRVPDELRTALTNITEHAVRH